MENPFVYGEIVPRSAFADRDEELERLIGDLGNGQKVFLISPRRYGKSSLVRQALDALAKQRVATVEVTVASFSSYVAFLEGYARALWRVLALVSRRGSIHYEVVPTLRRAELVAALAPPEDGDGRSWWRIVGT